MFFLGFDGAKYMFFVEDGFEEVGIILKLDLFIDKLLNSFDNIWFILPEWSSETCMFFFLEDEGRSCIFDIVVDE